MFRHQHAVLTIVASCAAALAASTVASVARADDSSIRITFGSSHFGIGYGSSRHASYDPGHQYREAERVRGQRDGFRYGYQDGFVHARAGHAASPHLKIDLHHASHAYQRGFAAAYQSGYTAGYRKAVLDRARYHYSRRGHGNGHAYGHGKGHGGGHGKGHGRGRGHGYTHSKHRVHGGGVFRPGVAGHGRSGR